MSSWSLMPLIPLFTVLPSMRAMFITFYIYSAWTLLAVMTGTVSFRMLVCYAHMTSASAEDAADERRLHMKNLLFNIFEVLDEDGSGELSFDEFQAIISSHE